MAIVFDLQLDFLDREVDLAAFQCALQQRIEPFHGVDFHQLSPTFVSADGPLQQQLSLCPKNVGFAVSRDDPRLPAHRLGDEQMLALSLHMYQCIRDLPAYQLALVGWELGSLGLSYLSFHGDRLVEIAEVEGLVVANALLDQVDHTAAWQPFDSLRRWIPCESAIGNLMPGGA